MQVCVCACVQAAVPETFTTSIHVRLQIQTLMMAHPMMARRDRVLSCCARHTHAPRPRRSVAMCRTSSPRCVEAAWAHARSGTGQARSRRSAWRPLASRPAVAWWPSPVACPASVTPMQRKRLLAAQHQSPRGHLNSMQNMLCNDARWLGHCMIQLYKTGLNCLAAAQQLLASPARSTDACCDAGTSTTIHGLSSGHTCKGFRYATVIFHRITMLV